MARKKLPKQFQEPTTCHGKRRYNSQQEAEVIAEQQELLHFGESLTLKVYQCHLCGGWHLTRQQDGV